MIARLSSVACTARTGLLDNLEYPRKKVPFRKGHRRVRHSSLHARLMVFSTATVGKYLVFVNARPRDIPVIQTPNRRVVFHRAREP